MTPEEKEKYLDETITISRREFADITSRLISNITVECAKECTNDKDLELLCATTGLIMHFTKDLMRKIFNEKTLQIEEEEK